MASGTQVESGAVSKVEIFDPKRPAVQLIWDASSLAILAACPHKYWLSMVHGWRPKESAIDLAFGTWVHLGIETFYRSIIEDGLAHDAAVKAACLAVIQASWHEWTHEHVHGDGQVETLIEGAPMHGAYVNVWHCLGDVKGYKNEKGNPAKCPYSHVGKFFEGHGPDTCGKCGGTVERLTKWVPEHRSKDRYNAVRAVVWYAETMKDSHLEPVSIDGRAVMEVRATVKLAPSDVQLVMNFDVVKSFGDELFVVDYKTTAMSLSRMYFERFMPNMQVDIYGSLGRMAELDKFPDVQLKGISGVAVEAMQVIQSGVRFGTQVFRHNTEYAKEVACDVLGYIIAARHYAKELGVNVAWPRNRSSCIMCPFKQVCAAPQEHRAAILDTNYIKARWNPVTRTADPV